MPELLKPLSGFIEGKNPKESVFGHTKAAITDKISRYAKKIGLDLHPHSLRHYCAGWLLRNGYTAKEVQEWLGHSRLDTTGRYLDLMPDSLHDAVARVEGKRGLPAEGKTATTAPPADKPKGSLQISLSNHEDGTPGLFSLEGEGKWDNLLVDLVKKIQFKQKDGN